MSPARPDATPAVKPIEVSSELKALMRRLKLGQLLDTLPERLALARSNRLPHHDFLEMLLADEVTRRDRKSAQLRAKAHLDPQMQLQAWDDTAAVTFDQELWAELDLAAVSRRRLQRAHHGTGRGRKNIPRQRFRAHRRSASPQRAHRTRRQAIQTPARRTARRQLRRRDDY